MTQTSPLPITETDYQVSYPEGTLYTDSLTIAMARAKCSLKESPKARVTVTEVVETRRVLPVEVPPSKPAKAKTRRAKKAREA